MKKLIISGFALGFLTTALNASAACALDLDNFEITNGKEKLQVNQGLFGNKSYSAEDRLGNKIESKKGWFGNSSKEVSLLGNSVETKKGLFGSKSYKGTTILGDKIESKRSWFGFGPRRTKVDVSGVSALAGQLINRHRTSAESAYAIEDERQ